MNPTVLPQTTSWLEGVSVRSEADAPTPDAAATDPATAAITSFRCRTGDVHIVRVSPQSAGL